ncbi:MAG: acylglycerol kinase family protein [Prolixibacteraceae bacterium]|nr:acylglycerol kinase family protein [Prolixibacteraceae bacterium]
MLTPSHATELAQKATTLSYDVVVAVGGDGTVNEVARGLLGSNTGMGIIPLGSGNGFARELKISDNAVKAAKAIINGHNRSVDVWKMNDAVFLCTSGLW